MKRLLAYLFLVLGLLCCNVGSEEKILPEGTPKEQYRFALSFIKVGDYETAEIALKEFLDTNAKDELAGSAQYWYAETFRIRNYNLEAATAYLDGYEKYPNSVKGPINLLKLGVMLVYIGEWDQGCSMITGVSKQYPKARPSVVQKAKYEFNKMCKNRKQASKWFNIGKKYPGEQKSKTVEKKKEKKKVAKVVEQEQEEIKIKTKKLDTTGPEIEIAEQITVDDSQYSIEGKVSDEGSDKIYVKVEGRDVAVKKGKFKINRYSPVDEEVTIVAIDQWGNKSTKVVKVIVEIKEDVIVQKLEPLNPSLIKTKSSGDKVAIIIGIENYTETPKATYANLDAKYFFDYVRKGFGVKKQNINLLIDDKATLGSINKVLFKWLVGKVKANQTDLIIFFAGHGLASNDGKELYFLPQDGDPDLLSIMALSRTKLFEQIIKLKPKSVTMFLDTCYSGVSRDEQMLLASARPIRIVAGNEGEIPDNFTIFSATELDQISSGLKEAKHGIFSYYLMKGLEGKADSNKDKQITNGELLAYMDINVSQKALEQGRQQNPSLTGNPDQVLMRYR